MRTMSEKQNELSAVLEFLASIEQSEQNQISGSASSARARRKRSKTKPVIEERELYEQRRLDLEKNLGSLWRKLQELKDQAGSKKT